MGYELKKFLEKGNIDLLFSMAKDMEMVNDTPEGIELFGTLVEDFYQKNQYRISNNSIKLDDLNKMFIQDLMVRNFDNLTSGWFSKNYDDTYDDSK